jgi:rhamnopyranosyl-N-acetylglucosaminyl-diphospho-decaprenol beta-1,3/1,4-galactofuranosyltransferase
MPESVAAVVVTYNRKDLLRRTLDAVLAQTRPANEIVVVDNASSDGTREMLERVYGDRVNRIHMLSNVGSAGGFFMGMKWARDRGTEWIWLMDDDGVPAPNCLEKLTGEGRTDTLDIVNPLVVEIDDPECLVFRLKLGHEAVASVSRLKEMVSGNLVANEINPWNGTLIRAASVDVIGEIKAEMFIWGEEVEYWKRALKHKLRVATALDAEFRHPPARTQTVHVRGLGTFTLPNPNRAPVYYRNIGYLLARDKGYFYAFGKGVSYLLFFGSRRLWNHVGPFVTFYVDGMSNRYSLAPARSSLLEQMRQYEFITRSAGSARVRSNLIEGQGNENVPTDLTQ